MKPHAKHWVGLFDEVEGLAEIGKRVSALSNNRTVKEKVGA